MHLPVHAISDASGNVYISDNDNHRLRKVSPSGTITTIAGTGICGFSGDVTQAASTRVCYPNSLLLEQSGSLDFADSGNGILRRISPSGLISTFAGTGVYGDSGDGNPAVFAQFKAPYGLAQAGNGDIFVSDAVANRIRKITSSGTISTVAGNGTAGFSGDGGTATAAQLNRPGHLAVDAKGNLYIADRDNKRVRMVGADGIISTVAGIDNCCSNSGKGAASYIGTPGGLTLDAAGNLYIALSTYGQIARLAPTGS